MRSVGAKPNSEIMTSLIKGKIIIINNFFLFKKIIYLKREFMQHVDPYDFDTDLDLGDRSRWKNDTDPDLILFIFGQHLLLISDLYQKYKLQSYIILIQRIRIHISV